jgi:RNA polymerase sigma factor (sigma-70 family)
MKVLNASYDGDESQRRTAEESLGQHVCGAGDDLTTRLFCKARRERNSALMNEVIAELLPKLTDYLEKRLQKQELSRGIAEIAACETLLKALRFANRFDCSRPILGWVCGIGHNEVVNIFRAKEMLDGVRLDREAGGTEGSDNLIYRFARGRRTVTPLDGLITKEDRARREKRRAALAAAIARLRQDERRVVQLRISGIPNHVIAKKLGITGQRAAVIYFKAKDELRRMIG